MSVAHIAGKKSKDVALVSKLQYHRTRNIPNPRFEETCFFTGTYLYSVLQAVGAGKSSVSGSKFWIYLDNRTVCWVDVASSVK